MAGTKSYARRWIVLALICGAVAGVAATAATARMETPPLILATTGPTPPLATGLVDPLFQTSQAATAYAMASRAGATYVRLVVRWAAIAPKTLPASGFVPADPTSPYYRWSSLDASVSAANAAGITPILDIASPPSWGYSVQRGTWTGGSPKVAALGAFATAIATHYDGSAPSAHIFSVWNEPNFSKNLYPQDPTFYRLMVNAVADAVHAVDPADLVVAGELAPFKTADGKTDRNHAIPPLAFMRRMLCISSSTPQTRTCNAQTRFDVWAHHPYSNSGPYGNAISQDGVELGDLPKMGALLHTAQRLGAITSAQPVQFWVTEVGWSSKPPNKRGVPIGLEARWVAESMYQMWKSGVTVGTWFLLRDRGLGSAFQSGLYFLSSTLAAAQAKPLLTPFSFPFVAYLLSGGGVKIWGRDTTNDMQDVTIQYRTGGAGQWRTVATVRSNGYGIFKATLSFGAGRTYWLRASAPGSGNSRAFALEIPYNENMIVIPFARN